MTLAEFKGDEIGDKDKFQASAFDDALQGCDVVVRTRIKQSIGYL
jgi:hypothetical protein